MKLSIVTTLYRSEIYIREFYDRVISEINNKTKDYEIIFVDDGSPDNSLKIATSLINIDSNVKVIELSKNFGHHKAIMAGLKNTTGDYVFLLDSDLEESPELLSDFFEEMNSYPENDVIYGVQETRKGNFFERVTGRIFYFLFNLLSSDVKNETNITTVRLMSRRYVNALCEFNNQDFYFGPICNLTGFLQKSIFIKKLDHSPTTYNFKLKYHLLINSLFAFSVKPLYFIFYSGLIISLLSFIFIIYLFINKFFHGIHENGWTSLMISFYFLSGIIITSIGTVAIYISKIHKEVKNDPFVIIKEVHEQKNNSI